ncbi:MAG: glycoside hydrolase family 57 protein [bacterium]|nr:glycoside hydrolase family 57 protein [bacterium]
MADRIRLALWWHMHQPCYRNGYDGTSVMPLTFIHATKDYYDMVRLAQMHGSVRTTFNLVPSLLDQIEGFAVPGSDLFLEVLLRPVEGLEEDDLTLLYDLLFIGSVRHQILPLRRYYQLYDRWNRRQAKEAVTGFFSHQELLDLQVLFLLAWTGTFFREEEPLIRELITRGMGFTQKDKTTLVDLLLSKIQEIVPAYRKAQESGAVEITSTPYYHPILPLLYDFNSARAVQRGLPLPVTCGSLAADAPTHVTRALERYERTFGSKCRGMWPSEGGVSLPALEIMAARGVAYAASDEEVLANSLGVPFPGFGGRRNELYRPWKIQTGSGEIAMFFRDRELSDLIGFTYQRMEASEAVGNFLGRLHAIRKGLDRDDGVVAVILDGENAWEHYPENGRPFLEGLYEALGSDPAIEMVTFSEALQSGNAGRLGDIVPGSWIGGRLSTWVGHSEKNRAWELVCRTRDTIEAALPGLDAAARENAMEQILIAEGSDWYWWFGDDHFTTLAARFDELFRLHLINAYRFAGIPIPLELLEPIKKGKVRGHVRAPFGIVEPVLDGLDTNYFEWLSAGVFNLDFEQGSMHRSDPVLRQLMYGFDEQCLYLRLDSADHFAEKAEGMTLAVELEGPVKAAFRFRVVRGEMETLDGDQRSAGVRGACDKIGEFALPLVTLGAEPGMEILLSFSLWRGSEPVEKAPLFSMVRIPVPEDYDLEYWIV